MSSARRKAEVVRNIDVLCVFPSVVDAAVCVGVVGRAIERGIAGYRRFDLKKYESKRTTMPAPPPKGRSAIRPPDA